MYDLAYYDQTWRNADLKQQGEDEFVLNFTRELGRELGQFAVDARQVVNAFSPSVQKETDGDENYAPVNESIAAIYNITDEIYELLSRMREWYVSFGENRRKTITGSEYWALVDILEEVRQRLLLDSPITTENIARYGPHYRKNIEILNRCFSEINFATAKAQFMQPLYAEILKQRTVHKMNIFIELKS